MKLNPQIQKRLIFVALLFCILGLSLRLILKRRPASGAVAPVVTAEVPPSLPSENATPEAVRAPAEKEPDKEVPPATVTEAAKNQTLLSIQRFSRHLFPSEKIKGLSSRLAVNLIKAKEYS